MERKIYVQKVTFNINSDEIKERENETVENFENVFDG